MARLEQMMRPNRYGDCYNPIWCSQGLLRHLQVSILQRFSRLWNTKLYRFAFGRNHRL